MKNQRPYLFDAIYRWTIDNNCTPHLLVDANVQGVEVPLHLVKEGKIVLNINPDALANFHSGDFGVSFAARFSGKSERIIIPYEAMLALFAKESGQGIVFPSENFAGEQFTVSGVESSKIPESTQAIQQQSDKAKKANLKLIK